MPLILYDYVSVRLQGRPFPPHTLRVPLTWLHDGYNIRVIEDGKLAIRSVDVLYEDRVYAYIGAGLDKNDQVVTSSIAVPVAGMALRTADETP